MKVDYGSILDIVLYIYAIVFLCKKLKSKQNEILAEKQKQILRNKINDLRTTAKKRNEAETMVKELLNKYHLTEEMLKDDDEDLQIKEIVDKYNIKI